MVSLELDSKSSDESTREHCILWNKKLQISLSRAVIEEDLVGSDFSRICAVDVAYKETQGSTKSAACAVITDETGHELSSETIVRSSVRFPYIPGHFSLLELPCVLEVLARIGSFDLLLLDCHGRIHPRQLGMACHAGICVAKPTIGVAKSLQAGFRILSSPWSIFSNETKVISFPVTFEGKTVGVRLPFSQQKIDQMAKSVYISVGNLISLRTAVIAVSRLIKNRTVVPLELAHKKSIQTLQETG